MQVVSALEHLFSVMVIWAVQQNAFAGYSSTIYDHISMQFFEFKRGCEACPVSSCFHQQKQSACGLNLVRARAMAHTQNFGNFALTSLMPSPDP
jgi:hypothetical protein